MPASWLSQSSLWNADSLAWCLYHFLVTAHLSEMRLGQHGTGVTCVGRALGRRHQFATRNSFMRSLRPLLVIGSMLVLSAGALGAQGAQVTCKDGSKSAGGQGACSSHGGISAKATSKAAAKAAKSEMKADAKVASAESKKAKTEMKAD